MSIPRPLRRFVLAALLLAAAAPSFAGDLSQATVVAPTELSPREQKAVAMLVEEVEKRSHVRWPIVATAPAGKPAIHITPAAKKKADAKKAEGFQLKSA